jgi:hypothetical protein
MLSRQLWQYFRGVPLPIQWKFMMCFLPHFGQRHSTLDLSWSIMTSGSSLTLSLDGLRVDFMVSFRLGDGMSKHSVHDRIRHAAGDGEARRPTWALGTGGFDHVAVSFSRASI